MNNPGLLFIITLFLVSCQYKPENTVINNNEIFPENYKSPELPEKSRFIIPPLPTPISQCISKAPYQIGGLIYNPYLKTISHKEMVGGAIYDDEGNVRGHWDGWAWIPDTTLVYDEQGIYFINHAIFTKKELPFEEGTDTTTWRYLQNGRLKDNQYIYFRNEWEAIFRGNTIWEKKVSLEDYKPVNDYLYEDKKGNLYVPGHYSWRTTMQKVTPRPELDFKTLKHVTGHYFTDKNGLYYLGYQRNSLSSRKLQNAPSPDTEAKVSPYYMVYGSSVYSLCDLEEIKPLHLNVEKMKEIKLNRIYKTILTDGENHYIRTESNQYVVNLREEESWKHYRQVTTDHWINAFGPTLIKQLPDWKIISDGSIHVTLEKENNSIIFGETDNSHRHSTILIHTPNGYYAIHENDCIKIDTIWIYNYDTGENELLEPEAYELLNGKYYLYKNHLYYNNSPVYHKLKTKNIRWLADTQFLTDGEKLFSIYSSSYSTKKDFSGIPFHSPIAAINKVDYGIDFETLQIISPWTLIDKNYLYNTEEIIPIYKLGLEVKVIP